MRTHPSTPDPSFPDPQIPPVAPSAKPPVGPVDSDNPQPAGPPPPCH